MVVTKNKNISLRKLINHFTWLISKKAFRFCITLDIPFNYFVITKDFHIFSPKNNVNKP